MVATLEPVVGPGKARANVTVEYDLATSDSLQETYDPNGSVVLTSANFRGKAWAKPARRVLPEPPPMSRVSSPPRPPKPLDTADSESQGLRTESKTFAVSKTVRHSVLPSGTLKRIAAAVLVDDATDIKDDNGQKVETRRKRTPDEMKQIDGTRDGSNRN